MSTTVNNAFNDFQEKVVNLNKNKTEKARNSRDWLWKQLNRLDIKDNLYFPYKYEDKHIKFGSFARKTKITPLDDIDLIFCLSACFSYYQQSDKNTYTIHTENADERLKKLSYNNILNSCRVVNKLKSALYNIEHYKSCDLHSRGEAVTLKLSSYDWNFDIVPSFYTETGFYLIPNGEGNWKATNPRIDQKLITDINKKNNNNLLQLIRTLKYWNKHNSSYTINSYLFEQFIINYTKQVYLSERIYYYIIYFFNYLSSNIYNEVLNPKGFQGNINTLAYEQKFSISKKAKWAYNKAIEAYKAEIYEKNQEKAINKWREIFGSNFPKYE